MLNIAFLVALDKPPELELHVTAALRKVKMGSGPHCALGKKRT
jgi:hypothetical protein